MRVRCILQRDNLEDGVPGQVAVLRIGDEFAVLDLSALHGQWTSLNIISFTPDSPSLYDARQFEVVDPTIPDHWVIEINGNWTTIGPPEFMADGFWEAFHDGEPEAEAIYAAELVRRGIDINAPGAIRYNPEEET